MCKFTYTKRGCPSFGTRWSSRRDPAEEERLKVGYLRLICAQMQKCASQRLPFRQKGRFLKNETIKHKKCPLFDRICGFRKLQTLQLQTLGDSQGSMRYKSSIKSLENNLSIHWINETHIHRIHCNFYCVSRIYLMKSNVCECDTIIIRRSSIELIKIVIVSWSEMFWAFARPEDSCKAPKKYLLRKSSLCPY